MSCGTKSPQKRHKKRAQNRPLKMSALDGSFGLIPSCLIFFTNGDKKMKSDKYVKQDKKNGERMFITKERAIRLLEPAYKNVELMLEASSVEAPLNTPFSYIWKVKK